MRIFIHRRSKSYEMLRPIDDDGFDRFDLIKGKPIGETWKPIRVERIRATKREGCKPSDAPYVFSPGILVFRRSAVDALRDILDAHGELLPLEDNASVELLLYNPRAISALDHERSRGWRDDEGQLDVVDVHVFFPAVAEGGDIFRQEVCGVGQIYFSERFVQRWKQAKLKGLDFILAWDSELPPEQQPNVWTSKPI